MSSSIIIRNIRKDYLIYKQPKHRLFQLLFGKFKKFYREFTALKNISFEVKKGEILGIVGKNGSGKSTLLQIICGTLTPTSGEVKVNGRISALLELGAGFNPEFTGIENIYLNCALQGLSKKQTDALLPKILDFASIGDFVTRPVKTYSSGMFVRLAFAAAVATDPEILIVDEALAVGDEAFQRKCFARIREIKENGGTVLFVSHSAGSVIDMCDRAILLDEAELILEDQPKTVIANYHKLIFVPENLRAALRENLKSGKTAEVEAGSSSPETMIVYEPRGAKIENPILNLENGSKAERVNAADSLTFSYKVKFDKLAKNVRFGMMIKTLSGVEIAGSSSSSEKDAIAEIKAGSAVEVKFNFNANLLPGTYFLNAGCSAVENGERIFLHRISDAIMFKLEHSANSRKTGIVDLKIEPAVSVK